MHQHLNFKTKKQFASFLVSPTVKMAQYQNQYDEVRQTDEYGNPVGQKNEHGNSIRHHTGTIDGEYGSGTVGYKTATTEAGKYGGTPGSAGTEYGNPVGQRDEYGNPIRHHTGTTDDEYGSGTVGYGTATTKAGKYGGAPGSAGTEYGNPVGQRDEYANPIGHHIGTADGEYGSGTVGYGTSTTEAGKYGSSNVGYGTATTHEAGKYGGALESTGTKYGNPVGQRDEYGNPIGRHTGTTDGEYGSGTVGYATATTGAGQYGGAPGGYDSAEQHQEKKGIMDKIKEKLPGHHNDDH